MWITEVTNTLYVFHWFLVQIHNILETLQWTVGSTLPCKGVGGQNDPHSLLLWSWFSFLQKYLKILLVYI